ncbi:hypothetical protein EAS68_05425 [Legionella jordanis]|nr:hypothetical protein EAS68_05425 [Legionella jordanis]
MCLACEKEPGLLANSKLGFIYFTYNHLIQQIPKILPQNRIVVEVLENVIIDEPLIKSLMCLSDMGYKIALGDDLSSLKNFSLN